MGARAGEFISNQGRRKVVAGPSQDTEDLLVWGPDIVPVLIGTRVVKRNLRTVYGGDGAGVRRIDPSLAEIVEVGVKPLDVAARSRPEVIVHASVKAVACAVIRVRPEILAGNERDRTAVWTGTTLGGLEVIDAAVVAVERTTKDGTKFFFGTEALANGSIEAAQSSAALNRRVSALAAEVIGWPLTRGPGYQIYGAANAIRVLARRQRLEYFDALDEIRRDRIQLDIADGAFRRRDVHAVNGHVAETRLGAADLDVFALAFVAFERNARRTTKRVSDVGVREA